MYIKKNKKKFIEELLNHSNITLEHYILWMSAMLNQNTV